MSPHQRFAILHRQTGPRCCQRDKQKKGDLILVPRKGSCCLLSPSPIILNWFFRVGMTRRKRRRRRRRKRKGSFGAPTKEGERQRQSLLRDNDHGRRKKQEGGEGHSAFPSVSLWQYKGEEKQRETLSGTSK